MLDSNKRANINLVVYVLFIAVIVLLFHGFFTFYHISAECQSIDKLPVESFCDNDIDCSHKNSCYHCVFGHESAENGNTICSSPGRQQAQLSLADSDESSATLEMAVHSESNGTDSPGRQQAQLSLADIDESSATLEMAVNGKSNGTDVATSVEGVGDTRPGESGAGGGSIFTYMLGGNKGGLAARKVRKIVRQPDWWNRTLRTPTEGSGLAAPPGHGLDAGGMFATLPTYSVNVGEDFDVLMYANTAGHYLNSMNIVLYFSDSLLEFQSWAQSSHFNGAKFSRSNNGKKSHIRWVIVGRSSSALESDVKGEAIYLVRATFRFKSTVANGEYGGEDLGLYPKVDDLTSPTVEFVVGDLSNPEKLRGPVFCHKNGAQKWGSMVVR